MVITFCGHSDFLGGEKYTKAVIDILKSEVTENSVELLLGGYGGFDSFALECGRMYKKMNLNTSLTLVVPYLSKCASDNESYDNILYPELEKVPPKFAILHRNIYMVERSDVVIAYITHSWGGAYNMYAYAKRKNKRVYNLAELLR